MKEMRQLIWQVLTYRKGEQLMGMEDFKKNIKPEWHKDFDSFVERGEASQDFLEYLDRDEICQEAVERTFEAQAKALEEIAQALNTSSGKAVSIAQEAASMSR